MMSLLFKLEKNQLGELAYKYLRFLSV